MALLIEFEGRLEPINESILRKLNGLRGAPFSPSEPITFEGRKALAPTLTKCDKPKLSVIAFKGSSSHKSPSWLNLKLNLMSLFVTWTLKGKVTGGCRQLSNLIPLTRTVQGAVLHIAVAAKSYRLLSKLLSPFESELGFLSLKSINKGLTALPKGCEGHADINRSCRYEDFDHHRLMHVLIRTQPTNNLALNRELTGPLTSTSVNLSVDAFHVGAMRGRYKKLWKLVGSKEHYYFWIVKQILSWNLILEVWHHWRWLLCCLQTLGLYIWHVFCSLLVLSGKTYELTAMISTRKCEL